MGGVTRSTIGNNIVRHLLTQIGKMYLEEESKLKWNEKTWWIQQKAKFENACAYCGANGKLTKEHIYMINSEQLGLHHPGNKVPCCESCQVRSKRENKYISWEEHLEIKCEGEKSIYVKRKGKIENNLINYNYPIDASKVLRATALVTRDNVLRKLDQNIDSFVEIWKRTRIYRLYFLRGFYLNVRGGNRLVMIEVC